MYENKKVCIFVDGENLRHSIIDLFPAFDKRTYLPKTDWDKFFDWIVAKAINPDAHRIRTYWYVVKNIDFFPYNLNAARKNCLIPPSLNAIKFLEDILSRDKNKAKIISVTEQTHRVECMIKMAEELLNDQNNMAKRFNGWSDIHNKIEHENISVEFRKAGAISYNLFEQKFRTEKAVDVKLAIDLIKLKDIYDVAIIVSGDQDFVPAVNAIKDFGKHVVNVAFKTQSGSLLPGGARRLNQSTDWNLKIDYSDLKNHLGL